MQILKRPTPLVALLLSFAILAITLIAQSRLNSLDKVATELTSTNRNASLLVLRLQALTVNFELTLNEYYATVIDEKRYLEKSLNLRQAIDTELSRLSALPELDYTQASNELKNLMSDIEKHRSQLDKAMVASDRDWDAAREALFKINILSTQAIKIASEITKSSEARGEQLGLTVLAEQQGIQMLLYWSAVIALIMSLMAGAQLLRKEGM